MSQAADIRVPSSKSETHRALILGALSAVPCTVHHPLLGQDCRSTLSILQALGAQATLTESAVHFEPVERLQASENTLECGNSGTTLRLMLAQVARLTGSCTLTGDASLQTRPNGPLLHALSQLGATVTAHDDRAPITVSGPIRSGELQLPARVSSQYASALLLALSGLQGDSQLLLHAPVASRPYLDITATVARAFGLKWTAKNVESGLLYSIPGNQRPSARKVEVAGDWSAAAFPLVASALLHRTVRLHGLREHSAQGDRRIVALMKRFGQGPSWQGDVLELKPGPLQGGGSIDLGDTPDLFPALAVLAACANGTTRLFGAPSLRHKECDRIDAMAQGLACLGARFEELPDGLLMYGGAPLGGGAVQSHQDHRVYMAFRVLGAHLRMRHGVEVTVSGAGCEGVSYPNFVADLMRITHGE